MYSGFIQMLPSEIFLQITNLNSDIAFGGNIIVELINSCQEVIKDITDQFFYDEFTDIKGVKQIAFEFGNIGIDYYGELLFLKLTHTVSYAVWFSSGFLITDNQVEMTTRFDYKNENYFKGISYDRANFFQSIRLQCFKNDIDVSNETNEYTQLSGNVISLRNIITNINKYKFYTCDFFTFKRLVILLNHDIIYIDSNRISNKPQTSKGERVVDTNFFELDFESNPTEEYRQFGSQINIVIPVCELVVSGISATLASSIITANWTNSTIPFGVIFEISTDDQLTWHVPTGLVVGFLKNTATYTDPLVSHHIRITPKCAADSFGLPTIYLYTHPVLPVCVIPTLNSATKNPTSNVVTYDWNVNGFDYTTGTALLEYSTDNGTTWITGATVSPNGPTNTVTVTGVGLGDPIKYKVVCYGNGCSGMISNVIATTFGESSETLPTYSYWYESNWAADDTIHHPEINSWVDYKDENAVTHRFMLGSLENGCQEIIASSIVAMNGCHSCA